MIRFLVRNFLTGLFCCLLPIFANAQAGVVVEVRGTWQLNGSSESLRIGDTLPASGVIRNPSFKRNDYITFSNSNGNDLRSCSSDCTVPYQTASTASTSIFEPLIRWWKGSPKTRAKGGGRSGILPDGITKLENNKIKLIFPDKPKGENETVYLHWRKINPNDNTFGKWSKTLSFQSENEIVIENLEAGLYEVNEQRVLGEGFINTPYSAWILVSSDQTYQKDLQTFQSLMALTKGWKDKVKSDTIDFFLRTQLLILAQENEK